VDEQVFTGEHRPEYTRDTSKDDAANQGGGKNDYSTHKQRGGDSVAIDSKDNRVKKDTDADDSAEPAIRGNSSCRIIWFTDTFHADNPQDRLQRIFFLRQMAYYTLSQGDASI
jgi:hypothetical protein